MSEPRSYVCKRCDVKGFGKVCWFCGKDDRFDAALNTQVSGAWAMFFDLMRAGMRPQ